MANMKSPGSRKTVGIIIAVAVVAVLLVVLLLLLSGSGGVSVFIDPQEITLEVGQTYTLGVSTADGAKLTRAVQWDCDTAGVATVDEDGTLTAVSPGNAQITAVVTRGNHEYVARAQVSVWAADGSKITVSGDSTQEPPDMRGDKFTVGSATEGVAYDTTEGTIHIPEELKKSETIFINSRNYPCSNAWELRGTINRADINDTSFISFGVIDETGKEQWFCIYGKGLSRQRYYNWADTKYDVDNVYVGFNQASASFYARDEKAGGNRLDFVVILKDDVLKVYFGNQYEEMALAWSLPLTQSTFGGFAKGSTYQLGLNTVDPCDITITNISSKNGEDVKDLGGVVGGKFADVKVSGDRFAISDSTIGVSYDGGKGTVSIKETVSQTEMFFAAGQDRTCSDRWEMSGTIVKENLEDTVFLSFGVKDKTGKTQWFCIYGNSMSLQKEWNWADTQQKVDGVNVKFNQAACSFFWKEKDQGAEKLNYKLILQNDVLQVYFGSDKYPLSQAWYLPLTDALYGGFAAGSCYQLGIATWDPLNMDITDIVVNTGDQAVVVPDYVEGGKFVLANQTTNVEDDPLAGTITVSDTADRSEIIFAASPYDGASKAWELSGTVTKEEIKNLFLSFGVKDTAGKEQWFCIYGKGLSRQRYYNWADTAQPVDNVNVFANPATEHFYYKTPSLGGDKLHFKLVVRDDVLKAYFGNDMYDMTLAWVLPLTEELWGGFAAGSEYQLGINTVDPCPITITDISVVTGEAVSDADYVEQLYDVSRFADAAALLEQKLETSAKDDITTVFIGDSFFHEEAFFTSFSDIYAYKEALCLGHSTTTTYHWVSFLNDWLADADPKNVVVNVGTNNLTLSPPYNSAQNVVEGLQELLALTREKFPDANVYWFSISPRGDMSREEDKQAINSAMQKWCADNGVIYIESPIDDTATDCSDGLHPTAATYEQYAAALESAGCQIVSVDTSGYKFFVDSATTGAYAAPQEGSITVSNTVSKTQTMLAAGTEEIFNAQWQLTGTVTKTEMKNLFLSFGVRDESGKEQWFCIYGKGLSRQRYYNWADTAQPVDNINVFANPASEHFYYKTPSLGGDKLHFKLVLRDDVLKAYFGNDQYDMTLAWQLPLTEELWGGFTAGSKYQLGINTVDPCAHTYTNVEALTGDAVPEEEKPDYSNYKFHVDTTTNGVTAAPEEGKITISNSVSKTETMFKANADETYNNQWQLTGTVTKTEMKNLFLSFGLRDENGKEQWFCIYGKGLSRQRYWNWANTKYGIDDVYVFANPASEHFYYKTPSLGGDKLHFKLVLQNDVLKAYFGNDQYDMTLAWQLPLTEELWGGFAAGSKYQMGINTVDPCAHSYELEVLTGDGVSEEDSEEQTDSSKFHVDSASSGWTYDQAAGTVSADSTTSKKELFFKADAENTHSDSWRVSGTVTKTEQESLFLSFGIKDTTGKEQWFCVYQKGLARQRYWNWANTKYGIDDVYVFACPASEHFFYQTYGLGGGILHYVVEIENDVLKAYFGSDQYDMTLAWQLPLTEELWGGFAAGSEYQLGINTVDPCALIISDLQITTGAATQPQVLKSLEIVALKPDAANVPEPEAEE